MRRHVGFKRFYDLGIDFCAQARGVKSFCMVCVGFFVKSSSIVCRFGVAGWLSHSTVVHRHVGS